MARNCGPGKQCGMSQGIYNPFFQNGANWYGAGAGQLSLDFSRSVNSQYLALF